ncbi:MAG: hypothetical protein SGILL_006151 [Bacillariaceae sp.]
MTDASASTTPLNMLQQQQQKNNNSNANPKEEEQQQEPFKLAPFNPSSEQIQEKAFEILQLKDSNNNDDILFDLGCGDGRLLIQAVQKFPSLKCVGIEIDPVFVDRAKERILEKLSPQLQSRIQVRLEDALKVMDEMEGNDAKNGTNSAEEKPLSDLTLLDDATALYLFVLPKGIQKLMPILEKVVERRLQEKRFFRILSYMFKIHDWEPTTVDRTAKGGCPIYYYEWNAAAATAK